MEPADKNNFDKTTEGRKVEDNKEIIIKESVNNKVNNKNYWGLYILIAILIFSFILHIYYFIETKEQVVWWDEAEYLVKAKSIALGTSDQGWNPLRELFMSLFWAALYKFGATEIIIRMSSILIAILSIYFTYLVGKEIFSEWIGLMAAFLMSIYNQNIFFSFRMLIDIPATLFWLLSVYFFWKGYVKSKSLKYMILSGVSIAIGFLAHYSLLFLLIAMVIFIVITQNVKFIREKNLWITLLIIILLVSPYILWSLIKYKTPLPRYSAAYVASQTQPFTPSAWNSYLKYIPLHLQTTLLIFFIIGLILLLLNLILSFDLITKNKDKSTYKYLLTLLWFIVPLSIYTYASIESSGYSEPRYLLIMLPPISYITSMGLEKIFMLIKRKSKAIAITVILLILVFSAFTQIKAADSLIKSKLGGPLDSIKQAGLFIKENTNKGDTIMINSMQLELEYYSERRVIGFSPNETAMTPKISSDNVKYIIVNGLYPADQWTFEFPSNHQDLLEPVQGYFVDEEKKQPTLIIFKVKQ